MIARGALLALLPVLAGIALTRRRRSAAIIGMGLFSLTLAGTYLLLHAPDVAVTEAAIGAALVTVIYVLAIRHTGRLVVAADEAPGLLAREEEEIVGLEIDILAGFARHSGLDLVVNLLPRREVEEAALRGEADICAGGIVAHNDARFLRTTPHLPTALIHLRRTGIPSPGEGERCPPPHAGYFSDLVDEVRAGRDLAVTVDLARFLALSRHDLSGWAVERLPEEHAYSFLLSGQRGDLHGKLAAHLDALQKSGDLDAMIRRHFP